MIRHDTSAHATYRHLDDSPVTSNPIVIADVELFICNITLQTILQC